MLNFINNIVRKSCGSFSSVKPLPSVYTDSEIFSTVPNHTREGTINKHQPVSNEIFGENNRTLVPDREENISTYGHKFESAFGNTLIKESFNKDTNIIESPVQKKGEFPKFNEHDERSAENSGKSTDEVPVKPKIIPEYGEVPPLNLKATGKQVISVTAVHSAEQVYRSSNENNPQAKRNIEGHVNIQEDNPGQFPESRLKKEGSGKQTIMQPYIEKKPLKNIAAVSGQDAVTIINIEPLHKNQQQVFAEELIKRNKAGAISPPVERKNLNADSTKYGREVSVNIGRIEINSRPQKKSPAKTPVQGFEDQLMMRLYMDRYFYKVFL